MGLESRKKAKPRTRPLRDRAAKGSGSSAASSEVGTEPEDDVPRAAPSKPKGRARIQKAASIEPGASDEEELEPRLLVLNGTTPSPRETPPPIRGSASKGSARKRRRGSEEASETPASQRKKDKEMNPPEGGDEDSFVGRKLKRIKR